MKIEHVAIWCRDLDALCEFYVQRFGAHPGPLYHNPRTGFRSYFLGFGDGARLELMARAEVPASQDDPLRQRQGLIHLAFSVGSEEAVDRHHAQSLAEGLRVLDGPRRTGDGYYEYVLLDPEENRIEVTV